MTNQGSAGQAGPRETDEGRQDEVGPRRTNRASVEEAVSPPPRAIPPLSVIELRDKNQLIA